MLKDTHNACTPQSSIWRCLPTGDLMINAKDIVPPNVSVGIYILNLGQVCGKGRGDGCERENVWLIDE